MQLWRTTMNRILAAIAALAAICCLCLPVSPQSVSGELVGTVFDGSGAAVPGATVSATNLATGYQATATSSANGQYILPNLPTGTYNLKVSAPGFSAAQVKNLVVSLNVTSTTNITLEVGEAKTVVEVSAAAVTIDTTTAQVQSTFD